MKRILDSWPYVLAMVVGFLSWKVLWLLPIPETDWKAWVFLPIYLGYPLAMLIGGMVLGFRRGYDWVTLLVCLVVYLLWPTIEALMTGQLAFFIKADLTNWLLAVVAFFIPATQLGLGVGIAVRYLRNRAAARS
jgi:hypothetical protein